MQIDKVRGIEDMSLFSGEGLGLMPEWRIQNAQVAKQTERVTGFLVEIEQACGSRRGGRRRKIGALRG